MTIPASLTQLLVLVVVVIPGFVYQAVRIRIVGRRPGDPDLPTRVLTAISIGTAFVLIYVLAFGDDVATTNQVLTLIEDEPRRSAAFGLLAGFVVPTVSAILLNWSSIDLKLDRQTLGHPIKTIRDGGWTRYDSTPSAWDAAFKGAYVGFVRIRLSAGTWVAGYFGGESFVTTYPDGRSIYLQTAYKVDSGGVIGDPIVGSAGVIVDCTDAVLIELLHDANETETTADTDIPREETAQGRHLEARRAAAAVATAVGVSYVAGALTGTRRR